MKKITAYQIAPEYQTSPLEYSDAPENVYIFGNNHMNGINADEIDDIYNALETLADDLDFAPEDACFIKKADGSEYTPEEWEELAKIAQEYAGIIHGDGRNDRECARDALALVYSKPFALCTIRGCCQSDWQYMICPDEYGIEYRREIETEYFNTGDEWNVNVDGCECAVYTHSYRDDEKRQEIAAAVDCDPSDVILYAFDGNERTPKYKEVS